MVAFNRLDLEFILTQIRMAEAGQPPVNPHLSFGLREVAGTDNNAVDGQSTYGSVDQPFPHATDPVFQSANFGTSYTQTNGLVIDPDPRTISNLIVDQSASNPAAVAAQQVASDALGTGYQHDFNPVQPGSVENGSLFINNVTPDAGLSAPFNTWFTLFGQFFDHGLDLVNKGGNGTVFIPLQPDDPLYKAGSPTNFMVLTRATVTTTPGADGIMGTADDVRTATNAVTPFVDQNQTYSSHPSHQVFLREYMTGTDGRTIATGGLLSHHSAGQDGVLGNADDTFSMATWKDVKDNALQFLGLKLTDTDVADVPLLATDPYGRFIPGANGYAQVVVEVTETLNGVPTKSTHLVEGTAAGLDLANLSLPGDVVPKAGATYTVAVVHTGHAFLNDIAHGASPFDDQTHQVLAPDADTTAGGPPPAAGFYDNELLDAHYIAGDGRVNENIGLTAVHEVFHAEHNRLAQQVKDLVQAELDKGDTAFAAEWVLPGAVLVPGQKIADSAWNGERIFQSAKFGTETQYQHLVFEEFARKVSPAIHLFGNTNVHLDPAITAEFAHAVYRFGHSMLDENINRYEIGPDGTPKLGADGKPILSQIGLIQAFTNPLAYAAAGGDAGGEIALGSINQVGNEIDEFVTGALRNNLLGLPLDLAALNIARGRETGVAPLNLVRNQIYTETHDAALKPYESWVDFGHYLKHEASLVNFVAAYGTHESIVNATTLAEKRAAALELVQHGADGFVSPTDKPYLDANGVPSPDPTSPNPDPAGADIPNQPNPAFISAADIKDAYDFMHSLGQYANDKASPLALHDAAGGTPAWSTGSVTGLDHVDLWIGGLAEKQNLFGGLLGSTFDFIFRNQLESLQDGDRLYYLPRLEGIHFASEIEANSFAEMVQNNLHVKHLSASVFLTPEYTVEAGSIDPDKVSTWTRNAGDPNKIILEASWAKDSPTAFTPKSMGGPDSAALWDSTGGLLHDRDTGGLIKSVHFLGDENFFGNTMVLGGTEHADFLQAGNADDDTVWADGGNDWVDGGNGNDFLYGGDGNDVITDTAGDDVIHGDKGDDWVDAGLGDDVVFGGDGNDTIHGGKGIDDILGGLGNDAIYGGEGDDEMQGNEGDDWIEGGAGGDILVGDQGAPTGQVPLFASNDVLDGGSEGDRMQGFSGDDIMLGLGGFDKFEGRLGYDWASYEHETQGIAVDMNRKDFVLDSPPTSPDAIRDVFVETEGVSGSAHDDFLQGTNNSTVDTLNELNNVNLIVNLDTFFPSGPVAYSQGNIMLGGAGSDKIEGRGGNDIIDGDAYLHAELTANHQILREIRWANGPGDIDTAVFSDASSNYDFNLIPDDQGFITVSHRGANGAAGAGIDGTDKIRNVERLQFSDGTFTLSQLNGGFSLVNENAPPTGKPIIIDPNAATPLVESTVGTPLALDLSGIEFWDPDGIKNFAALNDKGVPVDSAGRALVHFQWETLDPARAQWVPIVGATDVTFTPTNFYRGSPLRVEAFFTDGLGFQERVASAATDVVLADPTKNTPPIVVPQQGLVGLPDTTALQGRAINLFLPLTTVFSDAETAANQLKFTATVVTPNAFGTPVTFDFNPTTGVGHLTGQLNAGFTGSVEVRVTATDDGPGTPMTVTDTFLINVVNAPPQTVTTGTVVDGYIAGARVFADTNGDGVRQSFEAQAITDGQGRFTLLDASGPLVVVGGNGAIDIGSNQPFNGVYKAPAGFKVVTPMTTLLADLMKSGALDVAPALGKLLAAFGLNPETDLKTLDPIAGMSSADPTMKALATDLFVTTTQFVNTVALLTGAAPFADVMGLIKQMIVAGEALDFTDPQTIAHLALESGLVDQTLQDLVVALVVDSNTQLASNVGSAPGPQEILLFASATLAVSQGQVVEALGQVFTPTDVTAVKNAFTGENLSGKLRQAQSHVGDVNGDGHDDGDGNAPPVGLSLTAVVNAIAERTDTGHGVKVAVIQVDDDLVGENELVLSGADSALFQIREGSHSTSELWYVGPTPDYDAKKAFDVTISASDPEAGSWSGATVNYHLSVLEVKQAPTDITLAGAAVREDAPAGTVIGRLSAVDPDGDTLFDFSLLSPSDLFTIEGNTVKVKEGASLHDEAGHAVALDVEVTDVSGLSYTETLEIQVKALKMTSAISCTLDPDQVELVLTGKGHVSGTGNDDNNLIIGNRGNNLLDGKGGGDEMRGGWGDDKYIVDNLGDRVYEAKGQGYDSVYSSVSFSLQGQEIERLCLRGSADLVGVGNGLANVILGNAGHNRLVGLGGNDKLDGRGGADESWGGAGRDVFIFKSVAEMGVGRGNRDVIGDMNAGGVHDVIDLRGIDANVHRGGNQAFTWVSGAFTAAGQAHAIKDGHGNLILQLNTDNDLKTVDAEIELQKFAGTLGAGDILL